MKKILSAILAFSLAAFAVAQPSPSAGVRQIVAGSGISVSPSNGMGIVTVSGGGSGGSWTDISITGTGGAGWIDLGSQSSDPSAPASGHIRIFDNASNKFAWIGASGYVRNFDGTLTASRNYTLQDTSGTVLLNTNAANTTVTNLDSVTATASTDLVLTGGSSGGALTLRTNGSITAAASGTNQSITLTPSGTAPVWLTATTASGRPTNSGRVTLLNTSMSSQGGIEFQYATTGSGYGFRFGSDSGQDILLWQRRFNSASWTDSMSLNANTGQLTLFGTQTLKFGATAAATIGASADSANADTQFTNSGTGASIFISTATGQPNGQIKAQKSGASQYFSVYAGTGGTDVGAFNATGISFGANSGTSYTAALTLDSSQNATFAGTIQAVTQFQFANSSRIRDAANGVITLANAANNDFTRLQFGGTTSSFPALKRSSAQIDVRLADDSGYADIRAGALISTTVAYLVKADSALNNGAAAQVATLTNGPTAGNPTKWIPINDAGTIRYIPAW